MVDRLEMVSRHVGTENQRDNAVRARRVMIARHRDRAYGIELAHSCLDCCLANFFQFLAVEGLAKRDTQADFRSAQIALDVIMPLGFAESAWLALIPFTGVVGGYIASSLVANRSVYINAITKERSQWIEKLRSNVAEFTVELEIYNMIVDIVFGPSSGDFADYSAISKTEFIEQRRKVERSSAVLLLQLNPNGVIDGNIAKMVELGHQCRDKSPQLIIRLERLIIKHSQWLLKAEWEKVKWEARSNWWRFSHLGDANTYLNRYQLWSNTDGSFEALFSQLLQSKSLVEQA